MYESSGVSILFWYLLIVMNIHAQVIEQCLRKPALEKELEAVSGGAGTSVTLLSLMASMSWLVFVQCLYCCTFFCVYDR